MLVYRQAMSTAGTSSNLRKVFFCFLPVLDGDMSRRESFVSATLALSLKELSRELDMSLWG